MFIILFSLLVGSFLSMCIYRIPRGAGYEELHELKEGETYEPLAIDKPRRSFCPYCKQQLLWWHNIPAFSWLILRGQCAFCKTPISSRYISVELLSVFFALLSYSYFGPTPTAVLIYLFCAALIVITFIDYDFFIIPNSISLPGTAIGIGLAVVNEFFGIFMAPVVPGLLECGLGILFGAGFLYLVAEVYFRLRGLEGLGMGDVKLLAMTGALFGPECAGYTIFLGSVLGTIVGVGLMAFQGRSLKQHIPFGPYLALGTVLFLFMGEEVMFMIQSTLQSFAQWVAA